MYRFALMAFLSLQLHIEAPPELAPVRARLESIDPRHFTDMAKLLGNTMTGSQTNLPELNRLFSGGQNDQIRAYALSGALVHDVLQRYGPGAGADILRNVGGGVSFDIAFERVTGATPDNVDADFWRRQRI